MAQPEIRVPPSIGGYKIKYQYRDVEAVPVSGGINHVIIGEPLNIHTEQGYIYFFQRDQYVAALKNDTLLDMVQKWQARQDPVLAYIVYYSDDSFRARVALFFYRDPIKDFLKNRKYTKTFRLTGKPDSMLVTGVEVGQLCEVHYDLEKDQYEVETDEGRIGYLPAAALAFAEEYHKDPEYMQVIVSNVEFDDEKERDLIDVIVSV